MCRVFYVDGFSGTINIYMQSGLCQIHIVAVREGFAGSIYGNREYPNPVLIRS